VLALPLRTPSGRRSRVRVRLGSVWRRPEVEGDLVCHGRCRLLSWARRRRATIARQGVPRVGLKQGRCRGNSGGCERSRSRCFMEKTVSSLGPRRKRAEGPAKDSPIPHARKRRGAPRARRDFGELADDCWGHLHLEELFDHACPSVYEVAPAVLHDQTPARCLTLWCTNPISQLNSPTRAFSGKTLRR